MELELIRSSLSLCETQAQQGCHQQAVEAACQTARLLLIQAAAWREGTELSQEDLRKTCVALVGVAGAVQLQLEALAPQVEAASLVPQLKTRLAQVQEAFADAESQVQEIRQLNAELLAQEEELRQEKQKLEQLLKKVKELTEIKEKELDELRKKIDEQNEKLSTLEKEYTQCGEVYAAVETELTENSAIIDALPESAGAKTVDELIAYAKQQKAVMESSGAASSQWIRQIIEEVQRIQKLAAGGQTS